jgi:hypothetical protein
MGFGECGAALSEARQSKMSRGFHDISSLEKKLMVLGCSRRFGSTAACAKPITLLHNLEAQELTKTEISFSYYPNTT